MPLKALLKLPAWLPGDLALPKVDEKLERMKPTVINVSLSTRHQGKIVHSLKANVLLLSQMLC